MSLDAALKVADTVLFEGYMLYPYRANDAKNQVRWQFGVLAPPGYLQTDPSERDFMQTDCLVEGYDVPLTVRVRFLHVQRRTVQAADRDGTWTTVDSLDCGDATYLPWDEAVVHDVTVHIDLPGLGAQTDTTPIHVAGAVDTEPVIDGHMRGRLVRERLALDAELHVEAEPLPGPYGVRRLRLRLSNRTEFRADGTDGPARPEALRHALVAAHLVLAVERGAFVSLIAPPEWAAPYTRDCEQVGAFPVLAGPPGERSLVLAAPIILYDHPEVAPESVAQFCDATEMDEMLTLRTLTLTDEEKRQVRGSDIRGAALVDDLDHLPPELMDRLHGAIRSMTSVGRAATPAPEPTPWWDPVADSAFDPDTDVVVVDGAPIGRGTTVRLRPGSKRADAQDMFLDGRTATVEAVLFDVDGAGHVAVSLDELADDGVNPHGRYLYFAPDEVEPLPTEDR